MYCLKPPMTQPPEGTLISFTIHSGLILYMSSSVYLKEATSEGYIWKRAKRTKISASLSPSLSPQGAGAVTCVWTC